MSEPAAFDSIRTLDVDPPAGARRVIEPGELVEFFADARAVHAYALIDLEEPYWTPSRWFRRDGAVVGVVANPTDGVITATAVSTRDPHGSLELLAEIVEALPAGLMLTGPIGLRAALEPVRPISWDGRHVKYELVDRPPAHAVDTTGVVALGPADTERLSELYATDPGAAFFLPSMLDDASFVGIEVAGRLVAAAGTHLLSERQRLAAVGSVFVEPVRRGTGFGRTVTAGVIERIGGRCDVIALNVERDNHPARAIYESLGFAPVLEYDEVVLA